MQIGKLASGHINSHTYMQHYLCYLAYVQCFIVERWELYEATPTDLTDSNMYTHSCTESLEFLPAQVLLTFRKAHTESPGGSPSASWLSSSEENTNYNFTGRLFICYFFCFFLET